MVRRLCPIGTTGWATEERRARVFQSVYVVTSAGSAYGLQQRGVAGESARRRR
uniref:Uncharacterized protein n=1 Tax=Rhizophora mucronata TaxID=61149 RepID=A0A2P2JH71_RHIMU